MTIPLTYNLMEPIKDTGNATHTEKKKDGALENKSQKILMKIIYSIANLDVEKKTRENVWAHKYSSSTWDHTLYVQDVVSHIAGFVLRSFKKCVTFIKCTQLLENELVFNHSTAQKRTWKFN